MPKGTFVWHELMTSDIDAAKAFYTEVIGWKVKDTEVTGWKIEDTPMPDMQYSMFGIGDNQIAGLMEMPTALADAGVPPHWLGYVAVDDVDATAKKITELGGEIKAPPHDIPEVGRFAVAADPQGAVFAVFAGPSPDNQGVGSVSWNELNSTDWEDGWRFYTELFGWETTEDMDMGPEHGVYHMYKAAGTERPLGGMSNTAKVMGFPPHWLYYVSVDDLDAAIERVKSHGGEVLNGPMEVPGGDKIAQCRDPQGAVFALHWGSST